MRTRFDLFLRDPYLHIIERSMLGLRDTLQLLNCALLCTITAENDQIQQITHYSSPHGIVSENSVGSLGDKNSQVPSVEGSEGAISAMPKYILWSYRRVNMSRSYTQIGKLSKLFYNCWIWSLPCPLSSAD